MNRQTLTIAIACAGLAVTVGLVPKCTEYVTSSDAKAEYVPRAELKAEYIQKAIAESTHGRLEEATKRNETAINALTNEIRRDSETVQRLLLDLQIMIRGDRKR